LGSAKGVSWLRLWGALHRARTGRVEWRGVGPAGRHKPASKGSSCPALRAEHGAQSAGRGRGGCRVSTHQSRCPRFKSISVYVSVAAIFQGQRHFLPGLTHCPHFFERKYLRNHTFPPSFPPSTCASYRGFQGSEVWTACHAHQICGVTRSYGRHASSVWKRDRSVSEVCQHLRPLL